MVFYTEGVAQMHFCNPFRVGNVPHMVPRVARPCRPAGPCNPGLEDGTPSAYKMELRQRIYRLGLRIVYLNQGA